MRYVQEIENLTNLKALVTQDLKELGVKPPKFKKNKSKNEGDGSMIIGSIFGNHLSNLPTVDVESCGPVPKFLHQATRLLEKNIGTEGLFRKSGSVVRQKELKQKLEDGEDLNDAHPFDVASLVKQFLRELPEPLLTMRLHDSFVKCLQLESEAEMLSSVMLLCLLLPWEHLSTLRFIMLFVHKVARHSEQNKMSIENLAVCLAPSLVSGKGEKLNLSESKLLPGQTSVVHLLMTHADAIGMVSDNLYERIGLMNSLNSCFPSEDELEKSESCHDDSKSKKKKKRSGSLQGIVSNLSNSFSRWRRDSKGHNNSGISDKSGLSYLSIDKASLASYEHVDSIVSLETLEQMYPDLTPKVMRKRKAEEESVPFSASKKKAILENMPQMLTLGGTPFTPAMRRGRGAELNDTPNIKFSDDSDIIFAATPDMRTPRRKMERFFTPASSNVKTKLKNPSGKPGCFTPKTPKSGMRGSVRSFFRRLSGGKDPQPNPANGVMNSSDVALRLSTTDGLPDHLIIMKPSAQKKKGMFRRHKKTPSSPARLLTHGINAANNSNGQINQSADCRQLTNAELASKLKDDLHLEGPLETVDCIDMTPVAAHCHRRGYSADGAPQGSTVLKRGKPNTLRAGLPSPCRKRLSVEESMDQGDSSTTDSSPDDYEVQNFTSPERMDCVLGAFDASPIPKEGLPPMDMDDMEMTSIDGCPVDDMSVLSRSTSAGSIQSTKTNDEHLDTIEPNHLESDHDRAFIHDSVLCPDTTEHAQSTRSNKTAHDAGKQNDLKNSVTKDDGKFKKPSLPPAAGLKSNKPSGDMNRTENDKLNASSSSDVSDTSIITVIYNGQPVASNNPKPDNRHVKLTRTLNVISRSSPESSAAADTEDGEIKSEHSNLGKQKSAASLDSALDSDEGNLAKSSSMHSIASCDSGVELDPQRRSKELGETGSSQEITTTETRVPERGRTTVRPQINNRKVFRHHSFQALKESARPVTIQRCESIKKSSADPNLQISAEMHSMLEKVGFMNKTVPNTSGCGFMSKPASEDGTDTGSYDNVNKVEYGHPSKVDKEIAERHASPLRFPNSTLRRRPASPVRIPTIFAKADKEAAKYRALASAAIKCSAKPAIRKPNVPISTNLLRSVCVETAKSRLGNHNDDNSVETPPGQAGRDDTAGHTPCRTLPSTAMQAVEINESLLDTIDDVCTPVSEKLGRRCGEAGVSSAKQPLRDSSAINIETLLGPDVASVTPRIKRSLISGNAARKIVGKTVSNATGSRPAVTPGRKYRSPVKPVKRLQGSPCSPKSPRRYSLSPKKYRLSPGKDKNRMSPIPSHVADWDI